MGAMAAERQVAHHVPADHLVGPPPRNPAGAETGQGLNVTEKSSAPVQVAAQAAHRFARFWASASSLILWANWRANAP